MNLESIFRDDDGERLGFVEQLPDTTQWQVFTIFKYPRYVAQTRQQAEAMLQQKGLMEKWYFFDEALNDWFACQIVEATAERIRYKIIDYDHPHPHQAGSLSRPNPGNFRLADR